MKLKPRELERIADRTLEHYNQRAEDFWQGTRDHDVSQNILALLESIEGEAPWHRRCAHAGTLSRGWRSSR